MTFEQRKVLIFHQQFNHYIGVEPEFPPKKDAELRVKLIEEELSELKQAIQDRSIIEVADAVGDLLYVVYGTAVAFGFDAQPVFDEIHRSNMTKIGGWNDPKTGKWIKPNTYKAPDIARVLRPFDMDF
jgi:predicted HAD superfamily Cof-like phosphohydrolase